MRKDENEIEYAAKAMIFYGSDSVKKIGEALLKADPIEAKRIKVVFGDEWYEYLEFGKRLYKKQSTLEKFRGDKK